MAGSTWTGLILARGAILGLAMGAAGCSSATLRVADAETGLPVGGARVLRHDDQRLLATTSAQGEASFDPDHLAAVLIEADGFHARTVELPAPARVDLAPAWRERFVTPAPHAMTEDYDPARRPDPCRGCPGRVEPAR